MRRRDEAGGLDEKYEHDEYMNDRKHYLAGRLIWFA